MKNHDMLESVQIDRLEIIYQDNDIVAINKPAGMLVHKSAMDRHETRFALQMTRDQIGQKVFPVHRLDKPTSGVLLFALNPAAARTLSLQFQENQVKKTYLAVVRGYLQGTGTIDHPLKNIKKGRGNLLSNGYKSRPCMDSPCPDGQGGEVIPGTENTSTFQKDLKRLEKNPSGLQERPKQRAVTDYAGVATVELPMRVDKYPSSRYSLVELCPGTGRRHQLRRHMKHLSHPIVGDTIYGKSCHNDFFKNQFQCRRLLLCALKIRFAHPVTEKEMMLWAKPDIGFQQIMVRLGWYDATRHLLEPC